jgi:DNA-binding PadR family transcriptional regulator
MQYLGEFEQLLLLAILKLDADGAPVTAAAVRALVEDAAGRTVWIGAVHTTLDRMENKGLVRSSFAEPASGAERGGRRKHFAATAAGARAIKRVQATLAKLAVEER